MLLQRFLESVHETPDNIFLNDDQGRKITFLEADLLIVQLFEKVHFTDTTVVVATNTIEFVLFFMALLYRTHSIVVAAPSDTLEPALTNTLPRDHVVYGEEHYQSLFKHVYSIERHSHSAPCSSNRTATIENVAIFTSGTLGRKKLVRFSSEKLAARAISWGQNFGISSTDRFLCTSTFAHSHGLNIHLIPALVHGARLAVIDLRVMTLTGLSNLFEATSPTVFTALPSLFELLLAKHSKIRLCSARLVIAGSERLNSDLHHRVEHYFQIKLLDQFGCVETGPLCLLEHRNEGIFVGPTLLGKTIRFVETAEQGVFRLEIESDVMADQIVSATSVELNLTELVMDDLVRSSSAGMSLIPRALATGIASSSLEDQIEAALPGIQCMVLPSEDGQSDLFFVDSSLHLAPTQDEVIRLFPAIRSGYEVSALPRTNSGKKLRALRSLAEPLLVSGIPDSNNCERWLASHFRLIPQYDGRLSHRVATSENNPANFTSSVTSGAASFHNDAYDYLGIPSLVALYCVHAADSGGVTYVSDVATAINRLPSDVVSFLKSKKFWFQTAPARHFKTSKTGVYSSIISSDGVRFSVGYLSEQVDSELELSFVEQFREALETCQVEFTLTAGQMLLINNRRTVHARSAFTGSRELLRFWID